MNLRFSPRRLAAMITKEFIQIKRDKPTFAMIFLMPIIQLLLFGFALNSDPKMLPTAVVSADTSAYARSITTALQNTKYFRVVAQPATVQEADKMMAEGEVQFIIWIPENFTRTLLRGERPVMLVEADASDPIAVGNALSSLNVINRTALERDLSNVPGLAVKPPPFEIRVHNRYNPEGLTAYNIVPGLLAIVLNMTLIVMTAVAMTRERERGTLESLLATPARPFEVMLGKIAPFVIIAYVQVLMILLLARLLFNVPILGSVFLLTSALGVYIAANLTIGFTISTFARNQLQAMQMSTFYFLPSLLLSGFLFPFRGMPGWAQFVGNIFPVTHALRIIRGIILKGNTFAETLPHVWPILLFLAVLSLVALKRYRETLD
ncbi:MAG: ABC transporter permease [Alphaproteobacteria bacterium]|nr:ABC transporter permease [Alphaproteobacteria bacterium]